MVAAWKQKTVACVLTVLAAAVPCAALADVWGYIDPRGVAHFAQERVDERYTLFYKGDDSFDTRDGEGAINPAFTSDVQPVPAKLVSFFEVSPTYKLLKPHLREASIKHKVDYELLQALIVAESGFDRAAVSPKGAVGLMQIMPATAERFGLAGDAKAPIEVKLTDPKTNIGIGTRYLRLLIDMFPGQLELALASYNAGEGAVQRAGNRIPNYKETQAYVQTVMRLYQGLKPQPPIEQRRSPLRVRMELRGGATGRGNLPDTPPSLTQVAQQP
jgi:soluble lytic murein transglycosylase-like protein